MTAPPPPRPLGRGEGLEVDAISNAQCFTQNPTGQGLESFQGGWGTRTQPQATLPGPTLHRDKVPLLGNFPYVSFHWDVDSDLLISF